MSFRWLERVLAGPKGWGALLAFALLSGGLGRAGLAQYPGRVAKGDKPQPVLRAVSVLEWTGEAGKPSASRLVPVTVFDGEQLNDGTIYLTRPEPLALANGVEYELETAGKPMGVFDVFGAGESNGAWRGFGAWKPLNATAQAKSNAAINTSALFAGTKGDEDDHPVLKRKHPKGTDTDAGDKPAGGEAGSGNGTGSGASGGIGSGASTASAPAGEADPDRPTLKRKSSETTSTSGTAGPAGSGTSAAGSGDVDPDRPTLHRSHKAAGEEGMAETAMAAPDPDRPRLKRGKPADSASEEPKLEGLPAAMQQAVAVSDSRNRAEHPWKYSWADPADEGKMKVSLEEIARTALGLNAPLPASAPAKKAGVKTGSRKVAPVPEAAAPAELADEEFRVFELAYGSAATMVLTAASPVTEPEPAASAPVATDAKPKGMAATARAARAQQAAEDARQGGSSVSPAKAAPQKFVTIIAQPDLYGGIMVLYKSVTDSAHLDETPRMRLVDAVDAMGDNRGELLFELRGDGQRQFALFRVLRGSAEQLFATVGIP